MTDTELGHHLGALWIAYQAKRKGIPMARVNAATAEAVRSATEGMTEDTALASALVAWAKGAPDKAGEIVRAHGLMVKCQKMWGVKLN